MDLMRLSEPFPPSKIHWRVGATTQDKTKGIALAYIDARDVMERLDEVCGMENWQAEYPFPGCCKIGIWVSDNNPEVPESGAWIWKSNGAGETNVEGEKGQYSDAFKRAGVLWGIGRYLYDLPNAWVELENKKFSKQVIKELNERLEKWQTQKFTYRFKTGEKAKIVESVLSCLEGGDGHGLKEIMNEYPEIEMNMKVWALFNPSQRDSMKKLMEGL